MYQTWQKTAQKRHFFHKISFFLKKNITREDLSRYSDSQEELEKLNKFYDITKGLIKFNKVKEVKELLAKVEQ